MEGFSFPNPMSADEIDLPASELMDETIRTIALKCAIAGWSTAPATRVLTIAKKYEDYIRNGIEVEVAADENLHYDENTLQKVYDVLDQVKSIQYTPEEIVSQLQNAGILFRERTKG